MKDEITVQVRDGVQHYLEAIESPFFATRFGTLGKLAREAAADVLGVYAVEFREAMKSGQGLEEARQDMNNAIDLFMQLSSWPVHFDEQKGEVFSDVKLE